MGQSVGVQVPSGYQPELNVGRATQSSPHDDRGAWGGSGYPGGSRDNRSSPVPLPDFSVDNQQHSYPGRSISEIGFETIDRPEGCVPNGGFLGRGVPESPGPPPPPPPPPPPAGQPSGQRHYREQEGAPPPLRSAPSFASSAGSAPSCMGGGSVGRQQRTAWQEGDVVEVFSTSGNRWYVASIVQVSNQVLTVLFYDEAGPKNKSLYRTDVQLAPLGSNCSDLPPGFVVKPSQNRPGMMAYLDATTGLKYGTLEMAWQTHFERLLKQPEVEGMETIAAPSSRGVREQSAFAAPAAASMPLRPSAPMLAEEDDDFDSVSVFNHQMPMSAPVARFDPPPAAAFRPGAQADGASGKVALPSFGGMGVSNDAQVAYLGHIGALHNQGGSSKDAATDSSPAEAAYPFPRCAQGMGARCPPDAGRRRPPVRVSSPATQMWQQDPFSEWRRT